MSTALLPEVSDVYPPCEGDREMARPQKIEDLQDVILWIIDHDARIDVYWAQQFDRNREMAALREKDNEHTSREMLALSLRILAVERRMVWASGVGATIGAIVGSGILSVAIRWWGTAS